MAYEPMATDLERATQNRVIDYFQKHLNYIYLGNLKDQNNSNIIEDKLREFLNGKYADHVIEKAVSELKSSGSSSFDLGHANKEFYEKLIYGVKVVNNDTGLNETVYPIDFKNVYKNKFYIAEEVTVKQNLEKRPDVVVYVNGIAIGVLELKRNTVPIDEGIKQNITNQHGDFINHFFNTVQICVAGKDGDGMKYGTVLTPFNFYVPWRCDYYTKTPSEADTVEAKIKNIINTYSINNNLLVDLTYIFHPERLLDIIEHFIIYDKGKKKICRYNQYYAIKRAIKRLEKDSGIIWHTQGSGKTLTMVWLARYIIENIKDSRVLIITDREELNTQMISNFSNTGNIIQEATSADNLIQRINKKETTSYNKLVCSLVHKFRINPGDDYDKSMGAFNAELKKLVSSITYHHDKYFIFVDECHRTQSGKFHEVMKGVLPNAKFIGFTGTPLFDKKNDSRYKFGQYIHTYKTKQAEADGVVTPLKFKAFNIEQEIRDKDALDIWFENITGALNSSAKAQLKEKWVKMEKVHSARNRLDKIVMKIIGDFHTLSELTNPSLGGHAILVSDSIYNAGRYWEAFQNYDFKECAVITSYEPNPHDLVNQITGTGCENTIVEQYKTFTKMLNGKTLAEYEKEKKEAFINGDDSVKLLIVVDKLLTGFDAPPCSVIYLDKKMENHGLFQAICRTNRNYKDKDHGLIFDFKELVDKLQAAYDLYNNDDDILIPFLPPTTNIIEDASGLINVFYEYYDALQSFVEDVPQPKELNEYNKFFGGEPDNIKNSNEDIAIRKHFYILVNKTIKSFCSAKYYMIQDKINVQDYEEKMKFFYNVAKTLQLYSGDEVDATNYDAEMRKMLDIYIEAFSPVEIGEIENFGDFCEKISKTYEDNSTFPKGFSAEIIVANVRKKIMQLLSSNPKFYSDLGEALNELIKKHKEDTIKYKDYLQKLIELSKEIDVNTNTYPNDILNLGSMTNFAKALYDNIDTIITVSDKETYIVDMCKKIEAVKESGWQYESAKQNIIKQAILAIVDNIDKTNEIFNLLLGQEGI